MGDEEGVLLLYPKLHLLILDLCGDFSLFLVGDEVPPSPGALMDVFIEVSIEAHLAAHPQAWQFILNRPLPREGAGGRLKPVGSLCFLLSW